jgi:hypothetical protein
VKQGSLVASLLLACVCTGCSEPAGDADEQVVVLAELPADSPHDEPPAAVQIPPLAPGAVSASRDVRGTRLRANQAPISLVLESLAAAVGFAFEIDEAALEERKLTARIVDASIYDVLAVVLHGTDYELDLAFDPESQAHQIVRLRVGAGLGEPEGVLESELGEALYELLDGSDSNVVLAVIGALERADDPGAIPELEPLLDDDDPDVREAAAEAIEMLR